VNAREPRTRPPRRRRWPGVLLRLVGIAALVAAGVAAGEALHDNPRPSGPATFVRTLRPVTIAPAPVTVTISRR
jgi:hypothetical protein